MGKREYKIIPVTGRPRVAYKETCNTLQKYDYLHKKQSGGRGQYARVAGHIEPIEQEEGVDGSVLTCEFVNDLVGNTIPPEYVGGIEKGFADALKTGPLIGHP